MLMMKKTLKLFDSSGETLITMLFQASTRWKQVQTGNKPHHNRVKTRMANVSSLLLLHWFVLIIIGVHLDRQSKWQNFSESKTETREQTCQSEDQQVKRLVLMEQRDTRNWKLGTRN